MREWENGRMREWENERMREWEDGRMGGGGWRGREHPTRVEHWAQLFKAGLS